MMSRHSQTPAGMRAGRRAASGADACQQGFTFLELLIVMVLLAIIGGLALPAICQTIRRAQINSFLNEATGEFHKARQEAVRAGRPVVVRRDLVNQRLQIFANVDQDTGFLFQPDPTATRGTVDYEVASLALPASDAGQRFFFQGPGGPVDGTGSIDGLTADGNGERVAVFQPNGSIEDVGAFRFSEFTGSYFFELRIEPAATARIELRKYYENPPFGTTDFYPKGYSADGEPLWRWDR